MYLQVDLLKRTDNLLEDGFLLLAREEIMVEISHWINWLLKVVPNTIVLRVLLHKLLVNKDIPLHYFDLTSLRIQKSDPPSHATSAHLDLSEITGSTNNTLGRPRSRLIPSNGRGVL